MKQFDSQKLVAYMALISGLSISAVAVYYSVVGLTAIFAAAVLPIIVMGTTLEISKLIATIWLKQNWTIAPRAIKAYLMAAVAVLMLITSMGIFGFLSKAHLDQGVPTGDVAAKVAILDEKIKTEKDNIDADKKALQQMDAQVDQLLGRTTDDKGANRAVQIRKQQAKERKSLQDEIAKSQKTVSDLNAERAPIASELRKVEAEVGPIKYIAAFFYGATDQTVLEKAVTWVILTLIVVFDPLAVILLLASQISFQHLREKREEEESDAAEKEFFDRGREIAKELDKVAHINDGAKLDEVAKDKDVDPLDLWNQLLAAAEKQSGIVQPITLPPQPHVWTTTVYPPVDASNIPDDEDSGMSEDASSDVPVAPKEPAAPIQPEIRTFDWTQIPESQEYIFIDGQNMHVRAAKALYPQTPPAPNAMPESYVQNEEQSESGLWNQISEKEYREIATERTIEEVVTSVREGRLPLYKVPEEIKEQVKERMKDDR